MQNLIQINPFYVKRIFDLKGSSVDRLTKGIENTDRMQALKDLDFKWMKKVDEELISFNIHQKDLIQDSLSKDLSLLSDLDLMDYSLLLIIVDNSDYEEDPKTNIELNLMLENSKLTRKLFISENKKYLYILGVIDYLQKYNFKKAIEHKIKKIIHDDRASAVDSKLYAYRMNKFISRNVFDNNTI